MESIVLQWIKELAEKNLNWIYQDNIHINHYDERTIENFKIIYSCADIMFNDMLYGDKIAIYNAKKLLNSIPFNNKQIIQKIRIHYTGPQTCIICGNNKEYQKGAGCICVSCFNKHYIKKGDK